MQPRGIMRNQLTVPSVTAMVLALMVTAAATVTAAQGKAGYRTVFENGKHSVSIPLDIDNNIIRIKVRVNGSRELTMIFDTGASQSGIDEHFVKELGLKTTSEKLKGRGTGGSFTGTYIKSSNLSVNGVEVTNQPLAAFKINAPPGFEFDGIIGYDFIAPFVVEIDYQNKMMTLTESLSYVYRGRGEIIKLKLGGRKTPLIRTVFSVNKRLAFAANLELDTGADNAFLLNSPVVRKHRLLGIFKNAIKSEANGAGGVQSRVIARVGSAKFGSITINNPPVALSLDKAGSGAATDNDGVIGGEVLRRFKVIIDYSRRRMILEKNSDFDEPYDESDG